MKKKTLVFTATYNESQNIKFFLDSIEKLNLDIDLLLIDDNSPDNTWKIIQDYSNNKENINLIIRKGKEGLDTAHKMAYDYAIKNSYDNLITLDADLSHDPKILPVFIKELESNAFVLGSRYSKGGQCDLKGFRLFLSFFGNKFIKFIFNIDCDEFTTSFRGFNLEKLGNFNLKLVSSKGYSFFMETIYLIHSRGIKIKQIPIHFAIRIKGKSKLPRIELLRTFINVFKLKFRIKN
jgi:dolichol-phosphate mannosyltransferase